MLWGGSIPLWMDLGRCPMEGTSVEGCGSLGMRKDSKVPGTHAGPCHVPLPYAGTRGVGRLGLILNLGQNTVQFVLPLAGRQGEARQRNTGSAAMWLPPSSQGWAALPAGRQGSGPGKSGSCGGVEEGLCRGGGFSRSASCNFNLVRVVVEGTLPKSAPTRRCWVPPREGWDLTSSTPVLGQAEGGRGGCGKGELLVLPARCRACRERGKPWRLVLKQGCPFILLYDCILISTNTPPSPGCCQRSLYRLCLAC